MRWHSGRYCTRQCTIGLRSKSSIDSSTQEPHVRNRSCCDGHLERWFTSDNQPGTLRTRWTDYYCKDVTALELAREFGFSYLYDVLAPVIRNPIPFAVLMRLQGQFHNIIHRDLGDRVGKERIYLPQLEVLTEIGNEPMWFPVKFASAAAVSDDFSAGSLSST